MKRKTSSKTTGYLHGYSHEEQDRLYHQAEFLEDYVFDGLDYSNTNHLIEVGCGVGAQTRILLRRFPHLKITGVDFSKKQLERAAKTLKKEIHEGRVELIEADATKLPFKENTFDGAFVCWFLEHVSKPLNVLQDIRRVVRPKSPIYVSEVVNATLYTQPYSPSTLKYWFEFNDHQWSIGGDPFVGAKLANLLQQAGYQDIQTSPVTIHLDNRAPKTRSAWIEFFTHLLLSAAPELIKSGRVSNSDLKEITRELEVIKNEPESAFLFGWMRANAKVL